MANQNQRWLAGFMGFVWVHADSFLRWLASPFHSFVTTSVIAKLPPTGTTCIYLACVVQILLRWSVIL